MVRKPVLIFCMIFVLCSIVGCVADRGRYRSDFPFKEAMWIRDGKPLLFENEKWYPTDNVENLLDREMAYMGEYEGIPFYIEKRDVRPFDRLYTKFDYYKYRIFLKQKQDDKRY